MPVPLRRSILLGGGLIAAIVLAAVLATDLLAPVADDYLRTDDNLAAYATDLLPDGARPTSEQADDCTRSGWAGLLAQNDTCYQIWWPAPDGPGTEWQTATELRAREQGWSVSRTTENGMDLTREGYQAVVRIMPADRVATCQTNAATPELCASSVLVQKAD